MKLVKLIDPSRYVPLDIGEFRQQWIVNSYGIGPFELLGSYGRHYRIRIESGDTMDLYAHRFEEYKLDTPLDELM